MEKKQTRLVSFDIAKSLCIILVVIGHFIPDEAPSWYKIVHDWIYTFHMPLFMFASGYIYLSFKKEESYASFITKKVRRLMVPYFVTSLLLITMKMCSQRGMYVENPVEPLSYLKMFYRPEAGYFLWFIWSLFTMFLVAPFFKTRVQRLVLFAIAVVLHYVNLPLSDMFSLQASSRMLIWFSLGLVTCDLKQILDFTDPKRKSIFVVTQTLSVVLFLMVSAAFVLQRVDYADVMTKLGGVIY